MPTTLVMEEDEIALSTICVEAQAVLTERKANHRKETSEHGEGLPLIIPTQMIIQHTQNLERKRSHN